MKSIIKLSVIAKADAQGHAILKVQSGSILFRGNEIRGYDFACGNCDEILATGIFYGHIRNIVLVCNKCSEHNIVKFDWSLYVLKYLRERISYPAVFAGIFLMLMVSVYPNFSIETKIFVSLLLFVLSLYYKDLIQVFQEK